MDGVCSCWWAVYIETMHVATNSHYPPKSGLILDLGVGTTQTTTLLYSMYTYHQCTEMDRHRKCQLTLQYGWSPVFAVDLSCLHAELTARRLLRQIRPCARYTIYVMTRVFSSPKNVPCIRQAPDGVTLINIHELGILASSHWAFFFYGMFWEFYFFIPYAFPTLAENSP